MPCSDKDGSGCCGSCKDEANESFGCGGNCGCGPKEEAPKTEAPKNDDAPSCGGSCGCGHSPKP